MDVAGGEAGEEMMGQEEKMKVRQMLTLPGWFPGGQQPSGGDDDLQELVPRLQGLLVLQLR